MMCVLTLDSPDVTSRVMKHFDGPITVSVKPPEVVERIVHFTSKVQAILLNHKKPFACLRHFIISHTQYRFGAKTRHT